MSNQKIASIIRQLDASPTPKHLINFISQQLVDVKFPNFTGRSITDASTGFVAYGGTLIAWRVGTKTKDSGFRIIGAHSDSPCLRVRQNPDEIKFGFNTLGVEIYGSPLLNSWLDRDLGIAGHVILTSGETKLFCTTKPVARISQLAIHLDRDVNDKGLVLDKQLHLTPFWSTNTHAPQFFEWVASQVNVPGSEIVQIEAQLFDSARASLLGADESLLASGRLDNQASCWAAISALLETTAGQATQVVALFDHEEVGSESSIGAAGPLLENSLEQIAASIDISRIEFLETLRKSSCVSTDNAHAVHHNYPERHDLANAPIINKGPALKLNSNQRYATSSQSATIFIDACQRANVPHQVFVSRNNIPCGSTIGPITATRLGIDTVDCGVPQLSMHSAREVCGVTDLLSLQLALKAYLK